MLSLLFHVAPTKTNTHATSLVNTISFNIMSDWPLGLSDWCLSMNCINYFKEVHHSLIQHMETIECTTRIIWKRCRYSALENPSDPDTMTIITLEPNASSCGKNKIRYYGPLNFVENACCISARYDVTSYFQSTFIKVRKTAENATSDGFGSYFSGAAFCLPYQLVGILLPFYKISRCAKVQRC